MTRRMCQLEVEPSPGGFPEVRRRTAGDGQLSRPLRVAHVILSLDKDGGLEKVLVDALVRFNPRRVESQVYCVEERGDLAAGIEAGGIPVYVVAKRWRGDPTVPWRLRNLLRQERTDVVHSYSGVYRDGTLAGLIAGIPIRIHTDQGALYPDTWKARWTHRMFTRARDRVVAVSDELSRYLADHVGLPADRLVTIGNAVDPAMYKRNSSGSAARASLGIPSSTSCFGIVARLVPVKDHQTLLRAAVKVFELVPEARLLIVGDGPLRSDLEALARSLGIAERTCFLGHRTDVPHILQCLDVFVLSSRHEGTSLTLLEAMASGVAVVATSVGGTPEILGRGGTGLLVPPGQPADMAEAIVPLLRDPRRREEMGKAGQARVRERFSIDAMVEAYTQLYEELAREKGIR